MSLTIVRAEAIAPAFTLLPAKMSSPEAEVMLLAIGLQESRFTYRRQIRGPARGFWQFEQGTQSSRGGVWGVFLHHASRVHLRRLCDARGVAFDPFAIYARLEHDDVLAAGAARLMLWTDPHPLPAIGEMQQAWDCYSGIWRPGKPHPETWPALYAHALEVLSAD
ncbi:hypothetical protein EF096_13865 [Pseudomonas neustonica]|uniref:Uncharacterized protein n=1 Tax=Pseudomonas neustonica TaxID=2487346 RepID=A0ABX9XG68_9PSED|nr:MULTISPECIES: hypothetical protein [Pseudomonas]ROZ81516.1 hypothetical protein EF099_14700 [Pseudomonas sp. SSM44]ROZ82970.1 hypothetical protein EF096_13865 [Pseudomonas neustonica]|tara:strand:- start:728 stop:1222 length:495 start_codon:yes stop_codon:yes gene_type:complete